MNRIVKIILVAVVFTFSNKYSQCQNFERVILYGSLGLNHIPSYIVEVDGQKNLDKLIMDGKYDTVYNEINENNFPIKNTTKRKITIQLFSFENESGTEEILRKLDSIDYRPVTIEELLALGAQHPDLQTLIRIVGLGSVWYVPDSLWNRHVTKYVFKTQVPILCGRATGCPSGRTLSTANYNPPGWRNETGNTFFATTKKD